MSKLAFFVSATIVLIFSTFGAWASPQRTAPQEAEKEQTWPGTPPDENLAIAPVKPLTEIPGPGSARYYPYRQALTFRIGQAANTSNLDNREDVIGFQYLFPKFLSPRFEAGADLHENGKGHLHAGVRWIYFERSYFRPSYKIGVDNLVNSKENSATFTKLENYYVRGTATLEYTVWNPYSIRVEPEILVGTEDVKAVFTLGISRGF